MLTRLLPDAYGSGATTVAEKIGAAVAELAIPGLDYKVTVSLGVVSFPNAGESVDHLLGRADEALYDAKRLGRNMTVTGADPSWLLTAV